MGYDIAMSTGCALSSGLRVNGRAVNLNRATRLAIVFFATENGAKGG
jgi:hypothetical protein